MSLMSKAADVNKLVEHAERLNRILASIDKDLKQISEALNKNFSLLFDAVNALEKEVVSVKERLKRG